GNTLFFERNSVLEDAIGLQDEHRFNKSWVESTAVEGIEEFYRKQGYPTAKVAVEDQVKERGNRRTLRFQIDRGQKSRIQKIRFLGVSKVDLGDLDDVLLASSSPAVQSGAYVSDDLDVAAQ